jgi:MFS family permease
MKKLKLDIKKTIFVGLAFASITAFWEFYNFIVPLMLNRTFGLTDSLRGLVMGFDNILALFMLPLFGTLSDRTNTRLGKRTPYFLFGTLLAVLLFIALPFAESGQLKKAEQFANEVNNTELWEYVKDNEKSKFQEHLEKKEGKSFSDMTAAEKEDFLRAEFIKIEKKVLEDGKEVDNVVYEDFVRPAIRNYTFQNITKKNPGSLIIYLFVLLLVLIAMGTYRSPVVALMPDVTPEPLRSPANAIINLMGGIGTVLAMVVNIVIFSLSSGGYYKSYTLVFIAINVLMLIFLLMFLLTVKENRFLKERQEICEKFGIEEGMEQKASKVKVRFRDLPWIKVRNFLLALLAIFFVTMATDAINSSFSVYATENLGFLEESASFVKMLSLIFSGLAFIPVGYLAYKFGRKRTIMIGVVCIAISLFSAFFVGRETRSLFIVCYFLMNFGNVIVVVNTLPLVLENSDTNTVGKFTGFYYTATMLASSISPFLSGVFTDLTSDRSIMFIYGTICTLISIAVFMFVKGLGEKKEIKKA